MAGAPAYARIAGSLQTAVSVVLRHGTVRIALPFGGLLRTGPKFRSYLRQAVLLILQLTMHILGPQEKPRKRFGRYRLPNRIFRALTGPTRVGRRSRGGNGRLPMKVIRHVLFFGSSINGRGIGKVSALHTSVSTSMDKSQCRHIFPTSMVHPLSSQPTTISMLNSPSAAGLGSFRLLALSTLEDFLS